MQMNTEFLICIYLYSSVANNLSVFSVVNLNSLRFKPAAAEAHRPGPAEHPLSNQPSKRASKDNILKVMAPILGISERRVKTLLTEGTIPSTLRGRERFTRKRDFIALFAPDRPG